MKVQELIIRSAEKSLKKLSSDHIEAGYGKIGYHYIVQHDGWIILGRMEHEDGAHTPGHNRTALGICLLGTAPFTSWQMQNLAYLVRGLAMRYPKLRILSDPNPGFDPAHWWEGIKGA